MRWNSKTVRAIPMQWSDSESDRQVLYREFDGNDADSCQHFAEVTMYHFLGRRTKLFESRPFNYEHVYETDISTIQEFANNIKKMLHL